MTVPVSVVAVREGGNAAYRDLTINNFAPPPELVEAQVAPAMRLLERFTEQQWAEIQQLKEKLGFSDGILNRVAGILGVHLEAGDIPFEEIPQRLIEMVRKRAELVTQQLALPTDPDAEIERIQRELDTALADGDDVRARQLLLEKRDAKLAASKKREEAAEGLLAAAIRDRLDAAASEAALGDLARARLEYLAAADHFRAAIDLLPPSVADARWGYLMRCANVLNIHGDEKGDNGALIQAIDIYRLALIETSRERVPLDWAGTQNNLGNALRSLGDRESGTARLDEAAQAYRAALEERTRERVPLYWAATQNHLGTALRSLGERESNIARLEEALEAHAGAWEVYRCAGMVQYDAHFEEEIEMIKARIAAMRGR